MLNNQRILFGWVPTRANETDSANLWYRPEADKEDFIWAGTFVAHELYQREDGTLGCRILSRSFQNTSRDITCRTVTIF